MGDQAGKKLSFDFHISCYFLVFLINVFPHNFTRLWKDRDSFYGYYENFCYL